MLLSEAPAQITLKNILVATDFSPGSDTALRSVLPIAEKFHSTVHILHVIHAAAFGSVSLEPETQRQLRENARQQLHTLETVVGVVPHRTWLREGDIWKVIEDLVRSEQVDLIVVGCSGKSDVKKFFLGSVADEILRSATCPVLAVGPHVRSESDPERLTQLLYVTSLWEESHSGLHLAISLAVRNRARLMVLHVVEQDERNGADREWLKSYRGILRNLLPASAGDLAAEPVLRVEVTRRASARILQVADEISANMIVMDLRPEEAWATHLRDKVYEIISGANCPVLTLRTVREQQEDQH